MLTPPTIQQFKDYFNRDFPYGTDINTSVTDADINKAFIYVQLNINPDIFGEENLYQLGFLLYAAHVLVLNLRSSSQGLSGSFQWPAASKAVGSVSVSVQIPADILNNPYYSYFMTTNYGAEYLMMIWPLLTGVMSTVMGRTRA